MVIHLNPRLQAAVAEEATRLGVTPEDLALETLSQRFLPKWPPVVPRDDWERTILSIGVHCGYSPPREALSSEGFYD